MGCWYLILFLGQSSSLHQLLLIFHFNIPTVNLRPSFREFLKKNYSLVNFFYFLENKVQVLRTCSKTFQRTVQKVHFSIRGSFFTPNFEWCLVMKNIFQYRKRIDLSISTGLRLELKTGQFCRFHPLYRNILFCQRDFIQRKNLSCRNLASTF